ncbi:MAG: glycosyltransferase family 9 protein [Phycisphaerae bacterium]|nr:glycosyltransferase family 9 protein [Phycisphaerae bacterium]
MASKNTEYKKTLIVQPGAIGDCVITLALVEMLHRQNGSAEIDIMGRTDYLSYFKNCTAIDNVLCMESAKLHRLFDADVLDKSNKNLDSYDLADESNCDDLVKLFAKYDLIISFLHDDKNIFEQNIIRLAVRSGMVEVVTLKLQPPTNYKKHVSEYIIEQFLAEIPFTRMEYPQEFPHPLIKNNENHQSITIEKITDITNPVIICPGSGGEYKCWPLENYIALADKLEEHFFEPVFILGPAELERFNTGQIQMLNNRFNLLTDTALEDIVAILDKATAFVGNDSGISHIAGAMHTKTIVIFGPTEPNIWQPLGINIRICKATSNWPDVDSVLASIISKLM